MNNKCRQIRHPKGLSRLASVRRPGAFLLVFGLAAALAVGLSACGGSSKLLPGTTADEINANLDEVQQLVSEGDCSGASAAADTVSTQVEELSGVAKELKQALSQGSARLHEVVATCEEAPSEAEEEVEAFEAEEAEQQAEEEAEEQQEREEPGKKAEKTGKEHGPVEPPEPPGQEKKESPVEETAPPAAGNEAPSGGLGPGAPAEGGE